MKSLLAILTFGAALAQSPSPPPEETAPPEVDAALRARITQFYQAHVDGKYRLAEQVVAEENKDHFYAAPKPKYDSFEVIRINYKDNFTKAIAVVATEMDWVIRGQKRKMKVPQPTQWKLVDGQWFWYLEPIKEAPTPFGTMHFDSKAPDAPSGASPRGGLPADPAVLAARILSQVVAEKEEVQLSSYENSSDEVRIINKMPGPITLRVDVDGAFAGFSAKLDKERVEAGQSAILKLVCEPKDKVPKPTLTARIYVEPIAKILPVKVTFAVLPEVQKLLPKQPGKSEQ